MKPMRILAGMVLAAFCVSGICAQEKANAKQIKVVRFGKLWDGRGKLWTNAIVIVEGDRIRSVLDSRLTPYCHVERGESSTITHP